MSFAPGHRFGPYEIQAAVGRGGMGEVYRARDTRLGRDVAIKVSHQQFNERFDREARTISSLNHPNICALYDVGPDYLVMEYVDGESPRGPMAADEALAIALQIAEALREAHQKGIVHRDLKPANIKITPAGTVKVLDFGLAKALDPESSGAKASADLAQSPTITSPVMMSHAGMILGTAAYMAPEQARGKTVDARADIWAFGVVLYELLTGRRPFGGDDLTDTLASVVKDQPDLSVVPPRLRPLVEACLQKDPKNRLQSIGDVGLLLQRGLVDAAAPPPARRATVRALAAVAVVATLVAAALVYVHLRETPPAARSLRLSVPIPDGTSVAFLDLSPDGTRVLLRLNTGDTNAIYVRSLDANNLQLLAGSENARLPFWSHDGRFIAFFADNSLKVIPSGGGPVRVLCRETGVGQGGTWNRDGVILFATSAGALRRVDAGGGECRTILDVSSDVSAAAPRFLPDGQHFFYVRDSNDPGSGGVQLATLDDPRGRHVLDDVSAVLYTPPSKRAGPAHLIFLRGGTLMAQPFDDATLKVVGDPFAIVQGASFSATSPTLLASASADGMLVYVAGRSREAQLTWFDRSGKALGAVGPKGTQSGVSLSPDGTKVTIGRSAPPDTDALWLYDLMTGAATRLTPSGSPGLRPQSQWSADSRNIWFDMTTSEGSALYQRDLVTGEQQRLQSLGPVFMSRTDRSADGKIVVYTVVDPKTRADIWYAPIEGGKVDHTKAVKLIATDAIEAQGQLSPYGKWLAYVSTEGGPYTVYVRPFPTGEGVRRVYSGLSEEPRWRADGKELFFKTSVVATGRASIWSVSVAADGAGLRLGVPQKLFDTRANTILIQGNSWQYGASPDGQRFLVDALTETDAPTVNVITNWRQSVP